jgi:hypothetical protein
MSFLLHIIISKYDKIYEYYKSNDKFNNKTIEMKGLLKLVKNLNDVFILT